MPHVPQGFSEEQDEEELDLLGGVTGSGPGGVTTEAQREELRQRVRLACRNRHDNMLAFSMSFVNRSGAPKRGGGDALGRQPPRKGGWGGARGGLHGGVGYDACTFPAPV